MRLGLRIDVCTFQGLVRGVPALLRLLDRRHVRASFFAALGPDTSGRAILQVLRPGFLDKLRRTRAVRTYGLRTVLSGTLLPPRRMAQQAALLQTVSGAGHELALHGYDHRRWQDHLGQMPPGAVRAEIARGVRAYQEVIGEPPRAFGAPGWQCSPASLLALDDAGFVYASDTRGVAPFLPVVGQRRLGTPQLPTSLPTLDERLGLDGVDETGFPGLILAELQERPWAVLTLHAEMEGGRYLAVAERLLEMLHVEGVAAVPLASLAEAFLGDRAIPLPLSGVVARPIRGRAGLVAMPEAFPVT
jgi:peptidoglycan/xylan/chitin deacetylase (PgdA/CDA1 family)